MKIQNTSRAFIKLLYLLFFVVATFASADEAEVMERGRKIYAELCASCHGDQGQGVAMAYADPLVGDDSIGELTRVIHETMPEGEPEKCEGPDAEAVASYIHYTFYSEAAQIRNRPPRIVLAHLTAEQLRQSISDLYAQFDGLPNPTDERGVKGVYFDGDRWKEDKKKIDRIDPAINFDFGRSSPGEGIAAESFYIHWSGGIKADETGTYEMIIRSTCSFVFNLGTTERLFIDNHVQSGDKTEFRQSINLTAGRVYPFKIDFIQRKRKTELPPASISLSWIPPGGVESVIPTANLISGWVPPAYALQTTLPADDRSYGFNRGISISRQWDESVTAAALEFADIATLELWPKYSKNHKNEPDENRAKLRAFLTAIVETAFRSSLDEETKAKYVNLQIDSTPDDAEAIKRVTLMALKSPRFLYPTANLSEQRSQAVINRLALTLFDSLPSSELRNAAAAGKMETEDQVRAYAREKIKDYRLQAKTREFIYEWLNIGQRAEIAKNQQNYPGFDPHLVSDLKASLDAFIDDVIWGESSDYRQFFKTDWAYTTDRLAAFYGDTWKAANEATGPGLHKTSPDPQHRFGVLTHPYLMSRLAYTDTSSPIHRGVFLIRYLLGRTLRPPADAFSPLSPDLHPDLTTRERVQLQTSPESCQMCHSKINGLGFILENYDAAGRYRTTEREKPIDSQGAYGPRAGELVKFKGPAELAVYLATSNEAQQAFVNRAFQHFVKQPAAAYGADTVQRLTDKFQASNCNIRELLVEIAVIASLE
jgi:Protein of unknown function (DUF1588)/Protein of unknown function (DUF1592)/PA14 domain/Cytochrome C oxidase, cbb3-type, subunit III/Protein of unknown function (DUF1585)